jgi:hypothetical protein
MIWFPDLQVVARRPNLPVLQEHSGGFLTGTQEPSATCLQWRDRVGFSPTSHDQWQPSSFILVL